jgi:hypothetical protein
MRHLRRFEELDLDKYKNFLDKYQKTGYISTSSIKKLKEWGLDIKDFSHVENQVVKSLDFFRDGDVHLFNDYFMEVKDKYPDISSYFYYSLDVTPKSSASRYSPLDKFNIIVSMDENNLPSKSTFKVDTNISVIDKVVSGIEDVRKKEIEKRKEQMDNHIKKRPGADDWWAKGYFLRAKSGNFIENCTISPIIHLQLFLHLHDDNSWYNLEDGEYEDYNNSLKEMRKVVVDDIESDLNSILKTYFSSIGHPNINYKIEKKGFGWGGFYDTSSDIVVFNINCELN